jgi:hypothetical protein
MSAHCEGAAVFLPDCLGLTVQVEDLLVQTLVAKHVMSTFPHPIRGYGGIAVIGGNVGGLLSGVGDHWIFENNPMQNSRTYPILLTVPGFRASGPDVNPSTLQSTWCT